MTRRSLLTAVGVVTGVGVAAAAGASAGLLPSGYWTRRQLGVVGEKGVPPAVQTGGTEIRSMPSNARSASVEVLVTRPPTPANQTLPVCLALHPRGSSARGMAELGLPQFLASAAASGLPPFVIVAPDGGDHYWTDSGPGDNAMLMLRQELPGWLNQLGLPPPSAVLGLSMGGFGALSYSLRENPLATALLSPALFTSWADAKSRHGFPDRSVWEAHDPLRFAEKIDGHRLGVWCGDADVFYDTARELASRAHPTVSAFGPGDHTAGYWRRVLPEALRFISDRLR